MRNNRGAWLIVGLCFLAILLFFIFWPREAEGQTYGESTTQVLVLTTATQMNQVGGRSIEIQNLGPNPLWCCVRNAARCAANVSRKVDATSGVWALDNRGTAVYCLSSANQVSGAATIVSELR